MVEIEAACGPFWMWRWGVEDVVDVGGVTLFGRRAHKGGATTHVRDVKTERASKENLSYAKQKTLESKDVRSMKGRWLAVGARRS